MLRFGLLLLSLLPNTKSGGELHPAAPDSALICRVFDMIAVLADVDILDTPGNAAYNLVNESTVMTCPLVVDGALQLLFSSRGAGWLENLLASSPISAALESTEKDRDCSSSASALWSMPMLDDAVECCNDNDMSLAGGDGSTVLIIAAYPPS